MNKYILQLSLLASGFVLLIVSFLFLPALNNSGEAGLDSFPFVKEREAEHSVLNITSPIGTNVAPIGPENTEFPFLDLMKSAGECGDGEPCELNVLGPEIEYLPARELIVLYRGEGQLEYAGDVEVVASRPGRDVLRINARSGSQAAYEGLTVRLTRLPIHDLHIVPSGGVCHENVFVTVLDTARCGFNFRRFEDHFESLVFTPEFLGIARLLTGGASGTSVVRFSEWMKSQKVSSLHSLSWRGSVPVEVMVQMANTLHANPWFSVHPEVSPEDQERFASYVRDRLDTKLKAYIEYGNESWQANTPSEYFNGAVRMFGAWERIFGGQGRLVRIVSGNIADASWSRAVLLKDMGANFDALAIAPYMKTEESADVQAVFDHISAHAALAEEFGGRLIAYSGGFTVSYAAGQELYDATAIFLKGWHERGGRLFVHYRLAGMGGPILSAKRHLSESLELSPIARQLSDQNMSTASLPY